jgi:hypothetical protein
MSLLRSSEKSFDNYLPMLLVRKCVTSEMLTESYTEDCYTCKRVTIDK